MGDKNEQDIKEVEEEKREKSAHPVLAEESVGSCRTARFTEETPEGLGRSLATCTSAGKSSTRFITASLLVCLILIIL